MGGLWAQAALLHPHSPAPSPPEALLFSLLSLVDPLPPARQTLFRPASLGMGAS